MISINEVFLTDKKDSPDSISDMERMNLNAYLLDHFRFAFNDIHGEVFNTTIKKAIMNSVKSIDIPIQIVRIVNADKEFYKDSVIFQKV